MCESISAQTVYIFLMEKATTLFTIFAEKIVMVCYFTSFMRCIYCMSSHILSIHCSRIIDVHVISFSKIQSFIKKTRKVHVTITISIGSKKLLMYSRFFHHVLSHSFLSIPTCDQSGPLDQYLIRGMYNIMNNAYGGVSLERAK